MHKEYDNCVVEKYTGTEEYNNIEKINIIIEKPEGKPEEKKKRRSSKLKKIQTKMNSNTDKIQDHIDVSCDNIDNTINKLHNLMRNIRLSQQMQNQSIKT
jgi:N12 class adenine-specific DNA methylase